MENETLPMESSTIEYKEFFNEKIKKEICAFLNGHEKAFIYLGVNDKSRLVLKTLLLNLDTKLKKQLVGGFLEGFSILPQPI